jgi:hypothetical protein
VDQLLEAYSSWLFFERHFLHIGRFGVERAVDLIDTVLVDNAGAKFHCPETLNYRTTQRQRGAPPRFCPASGWRLVAQTDSGEVR